MNDKVLSVFLGMVLLASAPVYAVCKTGKMKPDSIYVDNGNGTVTDNQTGLMWQKCSVGFTDILACTTGSASSLSWKAALDTVVTVNTGSGIAGHKDWRLPNAKELASIVDKKCSQPAINNIIFPRMANSGEEFWTSTIDIQPGLSGNALYVQFDNGAILSSTKNQLYHLRLVRGGYQ